MENVFINTPSVQIQIEKILKKYLTRFPQEHKNIFLTCLRSKGYIRPDPLPEAVDEVEEAYSQIIPSSSLPEQEVLIEPENEFVQGIAEREHTSVSRFNRTFIQPESSANKLMYTLQLQGISQEEREFNDVRQQISDALEKIFSPDLNKVGVRDTAMEMYSDIKETYVQTNTLKGELKGTVKRGYILLVLYYALINANVCISLQDISVLFDNKIRLSDLPEAQKNLNIIFGDLPKYRFIKSVHERCLCNMRNKLDKDQIAEIQKVIHELKENGTFNDPALSVQVAAAIYYVTKKNLKEISKSSGISEDTIRKQAYKLTTLPLA